MGETTFRKKRYVAKCSSKLLCWHARISATKDPPPFVRTRVALIHRVSATSRESRRAVTTRLVVRWDASQRKPRGAPCHRACAAMSAASCHLSHIRSPSLSCAGRLAAATTKQERAQQSRQAQVGAAQVLARLLEAPDLRAAAAANAGSLTEEFFVMANTYLSMATKEGNKQVAERLEAALKVCLCVYASATRAPSDALKLASHTRR